jgi:hypothetical protein
MMADVAEFEVVVAAQPPRVRFNRSGQPSSRQRQNGCPAGSKSTRTLSCGC